MKVSRFKALLYTLPFVPLTWIAWKQSMELVNVMDLIDNKIKISGALNDGSSFAWFILALNLILLSSIGLITGKNLRWIPKVFFVGMGALVIIAFFVGFFLNINIKNQLDEKGYMECSSERVLTSRYSSRTYVLDLKLCDED